MNGKRFSVMTESDMSRLFFSKSTISKKDARWLETIADFKTLALTPKTGRIDVSGESLCRIGKREQMIEHGIMDVLTMD